MGFCSWLAGAKPQRKVPHQAAKMSQAVKEDLQDWGEQATSLARCMEDIDEMCDDDVMVDNFKSLQKNFYHANKDWTRYKDKLCKYHEWAICKTEKKHNPSHDWFGNFEDFIAGLEKTLQLQLLSAEKNFEHDIPGLEKNLLSAERNFE